MFFQKLIFTYQQLHIKYIYSKPAYQPENYFKVIKICGFIRYFGDNNIYYISFNPSVSNANKSIYLISATYQLIFLHSIKRQNIAVFKSIKM